MKQIVESVEEYLRLVSDDKKEAVSRLRNLILENIPEGFKEEMSYGMIGYVIPHQIYPGGYHCNPKLPVPFINLAAQKNYISFYHMGMYADSELTKWFSKEYSIQSKLKLDMGRCCIRFKKSEAIPFDLIKELVTKTTVDQFIQVYEAQIKKSNPKI